MNPADASIGSLFSGIGGLELGLERAGLGPVIWQAESDPFCRRVLAKHWPDTKRYRDVREVKGDAERPAIICGGFPCQDISLAGSGLGLEGQRSGLWNEFSRVVRVLRPRAVVIENVPALRMRGLCTVLGDLAACGYDARWDCIPAAAIGAPHRRDRIFLVAWRVSDTNGFRVRFSSQGTDSVADGAGVGGEARRGKASAQPQGGDHAHRNGAVADGDGGGREGERLAGEQGQRRQQRERGHELDGRDLPIWPPAPDDMHAWGQLPAYAQPAFCRVAHGVPDRLDRLRALGNAVVPAVAELVGRGLRAAL